MGAMNRRKVVQQRAIQIEENSLKTSHAGTLVSPGRQNTENFGILILVSATTTEPMPAAPEVISAHAHTRKDGDWLVVDLSGAWRVTEIRPGWLELIGKQKPARVRVLADRVESWDSSLLLLIREAKQWCAAHGAQFDDAALPEKLRALLAQWQSAREVPPAPDRRPGLLTAIGLAVTHLWKRSKEIAAFVGETTLSAISVSKHPHKFRWRDCLIEMQQCGAFALPIVGLINFLVGVTLAYTGALVLRQFGGDIWVADLVGLSMVREMGAMMTGIVVAGRTGAAFAAQIGNMKANEEIDALETLGLRPVEFLVLPRILALALMMPILALYGNALGIFGGLVVARAVLEIQPTAYWVELLTIVDMSDISTGIIKAGTFGVIVGLTGCLRGLQADRSAAGVGKAATSAVVTAILLIIVADSLYAVIFDILGW
jgi:phospholipid/cholesterol/gamma-HCH transport system permease protein